ncbi:MAG: acetoin utilization protein, partial [Desulfosporosinus sp.]|nr:acetoin utilization protein [Desulfosporosinus sp.]
TGSDILDAFLDIMGFRSPGQRVMIETKDQIGVMSDLAVTTKEFEVNIGSLAVYHLKENKIQILARLQGDRVAEVETSLENKGYKMIK